MTGRSRTLEGRVVIVTRPAPQAEELAGPLRERGALPLLAPAVVIEPAPAAPLDAAVRDLAGGLFVWAIFTSRSGVSAVAERLRANGISPDAIRASVAAVGEGTAEALRSLGVEPSLVPGTFTTASLAEAMPAGEGRVLLARADIAPDGLEPALETKGWTPVRVDAYRTRLEETLPEVSGAAVADGPLDAVTFTSASTVRGFVRLAGRLPRRDGLARAAVVCIGPVTAEAARRAGLVVEAAADRHTIEGLVATVERVLGGGAGVRS